MFRALGGHFQDIKIHKDKITIASFFFWLYWDLKPWVLQYT